MTDSTTPAAPSRILLVEDNAGMSHMLVAYLGRKGFQVLPVTDGERALNMLEREDFALVLSDIRMPGASGLDVLRAARARPTPPTVILMTAFASVESVIEAMKAGAYAYVRKPFMDLDHDLGQVIDRALEERGLRDENSELVQKLRRASAVLLERQNQIKSDLAMAGHIQRSLLPDEYVKMPKVVAATRRFIGENLSGDFFDIIPLPDGGTGLVMGTVMGRDLPAAILMAAIAAHMRELVRRYVEPVAVITAANDAICSVLEKGYENFVSVCYGFIGPDRRKLEYVTAGHPPPVHIRFSRPPQALPTTEGPFLGKYKNARFGLASTPLVKDDRLLLFTESVPYTENTHGTALSVERFGRWAEELGIGQTPKAAETLAGQLQDWAADDLRKKNVLIMVVDMV